MKKFKAYTLASIYMRRDEIEKNLIQARHTLTFLFTFSTLQYLESMSQRLKQLAKVSHKTIARFKIPVKQLMIAFLYGHIEVPLKRRENF